MRKYVDFVLVPDPPVVSLTLGSKLDASDIKEGDDVYFECKIKSHPKAQKVTWKKDVSKPNLTFAQRFFDFVTWWRK